MKYITPIVLTFIIVTSFVTGYISKKTQPIIDKPIGGGELIEPQSCPICETCKTLECPIVEEKTCPVVKVPEIISTKKVGDVTFTCKKQLQFSVENFNSALYEPSTCEISPEKIIEATKQFTDWKNIIANPPIEVEPTKEQLEIQKTEIEKQLMEINSKIEAK